MAETKKTVKKPAAKKTAPKKESNALVTMVNDEGKTASVHPSMVEDYKAGGYRES
jgi:hypothetical protein